MNLRTDTDSIKILRPGAQDQSSYKRHKNRYIHTYILPILIVCEVIGTENDHLPQSCNGDEPSVKSERLLSDPALSSGQPLSRCESFLDYGVHSNAR